MEVRATFHALVGGLEYPMFIVTARAGDERLGCLLEPVAAENGTAEHEFTFHRAKRIHPGHPA